MIKKILVSTVILAVSSNIAFANEGSYVGAGFGIGSQAGINIFAGYGERLKINPHLYIGSELFLHNLSYSRVHNINHAIGASLIPGVLLTPFTMVYTRVGIERLHNGASHYSKNGAQLGLGLQTSVAKNWDVRTEYVYLTNINNKQFDVGLIYKFNNI